MKAISINKKSNSIIPFEGNKGGIWGMTKPQAHLKGLKYNGIDQYSSAANDPNLNFGTGDFSVEVYFKTPETLSAYGYLIGKIGTHALGAGHWGIYVNTDYTIGFIMDGSTSLIGVISDTIVSPDTYYHLAISIDRDADIKIYLNSVLNTTYTITEGITDITNINNVIVGARDNGTQSWLEYVNVYSRFYNNALSQEDATARWNNGDPMGFVEPFETREANQTALTSGTLVVGKQYIIDTFVGGDDFTNAGGTNVSGNVFVATATTPTTWTNSSSLRLQGNVAAWDFSTYYNGNKYILDKANNNHLEMINNPKRVESPDLYTQNKIKDLSGVGNDLTIHGSPTDSVIGSLKALDFGTNTDKYVESVKDIEVPTNYLVAYTNSNGLSVNNSQDITTDNAGSIESNKLVIGKNGANYFSGKIGTVFASQQTMTATEKTNGVNKLLYLACNIGVWKGAVGTEDLEDTSFIGTIYQENGDYTQLPNSPTKVTTTTDFRYYDSASNLIYAPLPITMKDDMINALAVSGNKVAGVTDTRQFELGLDKLMFNTQKIQAGGIAISLDGSKMAIATSGDVIKLNFINPTSGRVLGYTRTVVDATHWNHNFYIDNQLVDTITNSLNEFVNSSLSDIPLDVNGSSLTITPSNYVLDDLIVDNKVYVKDQFRAFFLSDEIVDDLNEKILIAPVKGFSNMIIYSVDDIVPTDLQSLADANKDIKTITTITTTP